MGRKLVLCAAALAAACVAASPEPEPESDCDLLRDVYLTTRQDLAVTELLRGLASHIDDSLTEVQAVASYEQNRMLFEGVGVNADGGEGRIRAANRSATYKEEVAWVARRMYAAQDAYSESCAEEYAYVWERLEQPVEKVLPVASERGS